MQQEYSTTSRRPLDVEDYIDIVRRHKGWIIGPTFAGLVIAVVAAFLWPDAYISQATIRVLPPQVPERLVPSNVTLEMSQHINSMASAILSRTQLTNLITTYGLYPRERRRQPLEDVIEKMQRAIRVGQVRELQGRSSGPLSAFAIAFEYENRYLAQKVTQDLAGRFISENVRARASQSRETTQFLRDQLAAAKKELEELEQRRTEFRLKNAGRLPEELNTNLQTLRSLETQLNGVNEAIARTGQEKLLLESQLRIQQEQLAAQGAGSDQVSASVKSGRLLQLEREILLMESRLSALQERYRDAHPDIKAAQAQLAVLKKNRDALLKEEEQPKPEAAAQQASRAPAAAGRNRELEASIARLQSLIQARDMELEERTKEQKQLREMIKAIHARIEARPVLEQQYADLTRDYELAKAKYDDLNRKMAQSEIATDLTNRNYGETLEILDAASLPEKPAKPQRLMIVGVGVGLGLMLGVFAAGFREVKDTSLKNLKDVRAYTNLPVLGTVPLLENDLVVRRKRRLVGLAWSAACIAGVLAMSGSIYYYYATRM